MKREKPEFRHDQLSFEHLALLLPRKRKEFGWCFLLLSFSRSVFVVYGQNKQEEKDHAKSFFAEHITRNTLTNTPIESSQDMAATLPPQQHLQMPSSSAAGIIAFLNEEDDNLKV